MIVVMMFFFGGGVLGVMEVFEKLMYLFYEVGNLIIVIVILLFGLVIEGSFLCVVMKEIKELNIENFFMMCFLCESWYSEILIIFMEDLCVVIGLVLVLVGIILIYIIGIVVFDVISGLMIGFLLMGVVIFLVKEFYSLIIGESVIVSDLLKIKLVFEWFEISWLIDIKIVYLSLMEILVVVKVDIVGNKENEMYLIINDIEKNMC